MGTFYLLFGAFAAYLVFFSALYWLVTHLRWKISLQWMFVIVFGISSVVMFFLLPYFIDLPLPIHLAAAIVTGFVFGFPAYWLLRDIATIDPTLDRHVEPDVPAE